MKARKIGLAYALQGISKSMRSEWNLQIQSVVAIVVLLASWYFELNPMEWIAVIWCIGLVLGMELMNTAIEHLTDLVSPKHHELAGKAKDAAAAAVLICSLSSVIIGTIIFAPKLLNLINP